MMGGVKSSVGGFVSPFFLTFPPVFLTLSLSSLFFSL